MGAFEQAVAVLTIMVAINGSLLYAAVAVPGFPSIQQPSELFTLVPAGLDIPNQDINLSNLSPTSPSDNEAVACAGSECSTDFRTGQAGKNLIELVLSLFNFTVNLLFGYVFVMKAIGVPDGLILIISVPLSIISFVSLVVILSSLVAVFTGRQP
jgi:hypothetical protein